MSRVLRKAIALTTLAGLAVAGCGSAGSSSTTTATGTPTSGASTSAASSSGQSDAPIIIGAAVAQSGGFELYDNPQLAGIKYAMDQVNAAGGLLGGRELELVISDTKTDPAQIQSAAEDVLSKGADFVVTTPDYDFGAPAALAAAKAGKVSIGGAGAPEFALQGLGPLHFNVYQGTPSESVALAQSALKAGLKHPYLLTDTSIEYSKSLCDEFEKTWSTLNGPDSIVGKDSFKNDDPSIANQTSKIRATTDADFVVLCSYPPGGASAIRQLRSGGIDLPIYGGSAFDGTFWTSAIPDLSNFHNVAMVSSAGDDPNPAVNDFIANVEFEGSASYALFGYLIVQVLSYGIEKAGSTDGAAVAAAIETMADEQLITGPTTYTKDCHAPIERPLAMIDVTDGKASLGDYVAPTGVPTTAC